MAEEEWDKLPGGNLLVQPVLGYAFLRLPRNLLLRVIYAASQEDFETRKTSTAQLAISPKIAREMARTLTEIADLIDPPFSLQAAESFMSVSPAQQAAAMPAAPASQAAPPPFSIAGPPEAPTEFNYSIGDDPEEFKF